MNPKHNTLTDVIVPMLLGAAIAASAFILTPYVKSLKKTPTPVNTNIISTPGPTIPDPTTEPTTNPNN